MKTIAANPSPDDLEFFRQVKSANVVLSVRVWPNPQKPTLLLVHGYPDCSEIWLPVVEKLRAHYQIAAYDVRGAGHSTHPSQLADYSLRHLMQDLHAVIDNISPQVPVHVIGHDWGSIQSWEAVTEPGAEQRIKSYTSLSGPCLDHVGEWMQNAVRSLSLPELRGSLNQILHSWYIFAFQLPGLAPLIWQMGLGNAWPAVLKRLEGIKHVLPVETQTQDGKIGVALYRANILQTLLKPRKRYARVPVQIIAAMQDNFVSAELINVADAWVPQLWKRRVATRHWLQLSHPDALVRWIDQFVSHIESGQADPEMERYRVKTRPQEKALPFSGQLAVITGAGSGIGRETALAFAEQGMSVICADINEQDAQRTAELARLLGAQSYVYRVDVGVSDAMEQFAATVRTNHGVPDVVINNAGIGMAGAFTDTTVQDWQKVLDVNLWGVIHGSRLFAKQMVEDAKPGHIVNVASAAAYTPSAAYPAYATSKAAVYMLTECLRAEMAKHHIGVSAICPGIINTNITHNTRFVGDDPETQKKKQRLTSALYAKRAYTPDRVAQHIVNAVKTNTPVVIVSPEAKGLRLLSRFAPGVLRRMARYDVIPS